MRRALPSAAVLTVPAVVALAFLSTGATKPKVVELQGVSWYSDPGEAASAAKKLGKPLLTLQMMGRLDDDFC